MVKPMTMRILILGGYGNFGSYVARALKDDPAITLIIAGRSLAKAQAFAAGLGGANPAEAAGPVTVLCRSSDYLLCSKGDEP